MKRRFVAFAAALACATAIADAHLVRADVDPVASVDPFLGTTGHGNTFPGADVPFGMVQWSPDTTSRPPGGGYDYGDSAITGFSLTHLSGPGCAAFGDFPVLPVSGPLADPARAAQPFSHAGESASPGYYAVDVGAQPIHVELTVTTRSGIGRFTFPAGSPADLIVKAADSQPGDSDAHFEVDSATEVSGWSRSGHFCGGPDEHVVYFDARVDVPSSSHGTFDARGMTENADVANGTAAGGWLTFAPTRSALTITVKAGISFTSAAEARANLAAEEPRWDFDAVRRAAAARWATALGRIRIDGGTVSEQHVFYSALYHALLHPNVFSDADGSFAGFDGHVHRVDRGHVEYANFSGWDIYRTQFPLLALVYPQEASDMVRSLLDDARLGGWLPKWSLANTYADAMNGDSSDALIAEAFAFGARDFDARAALTTMVRGAEPARGPPGQGWYVERPNLDEYLADGYVTNAHTNSVSPLPNSASETLEYALDDFCIVRLALALGDARTATEFGRRSRSWEHLFDASTGVVEPRDAEGAFLETPLTASGQSGFQEGNAFQYTWLVPHDERALFDAMGGDTRVVARLDDFFRTLDGGPGTPYAWLGNEPSMLQPWLFLSARAPANTQVVVRTIESAFFHDAPAAFDGNDDLGTMSAWYVWSAMGLYPQTPGVPILDIGSPLFAHVSVRSEDGRSIDVDAPAASTLTPFVHAVLRDGRPTTKTWFLMPLRESERLHFDLARSRDETWGTGAGDAPPSWNPASAHLPPSSTATLGVTPASARLTAGQALMLDVALSNRHGAASESAGWGVSAPPGLTASPAAGTLDAAAGGVATAHVTVAVARNANAGFYDLVVHGRTPSGAVMPPQVAAVQVTSSGAPPELAFVMDFSDAAVTPIDLRSQTFGPPIAVGANPGDGALSADGATLYVANQGANTVSVVDTRALVQLKSIAVGKVPAGIRLSVDGATLWVSDYGDDDVRPVDLATGVAGTPIAVGEHPEELALAPDGKRLYVVDQGSDDVRVVDLARRAVVKTIAVGRVPLGIVVSTDGKWAFVTDMGSGDVVPIDLVTDEPRAAIKVGLAPQQPALSPDGHTLLVPNSGSNDVTPIDVATMRAGAPIRVGSGPFYVAYAADGRTAYVTDTGDNACVPIDMATRRAGTPIPTGNFPIAIIR